MKHMATQLNTRSFWLTAAACLAFGVATARAQTVTFGFQKGNLTTNSVVLDSAYNVLDGVLADANATALLTASQTAAIGSSFKSGSPNGQQNCGFFAYDLTQLANFVAANTSGNSSAAIASVSFSVITASAGSTSGGNYSWQLCGTDPFTSSCTWSNYNGVNPWTVPYQNIANNAVQYGYTGGGSALTASLNTNSIFLNGLSSGSPLTLLGGTNFISAITNALARTDKTLYLTLRIPSLVNGDSRQTLTFSPATTVTSRPLLQIAVNVTVSSGSSTWTGGGGNNSWTTAGNWSPSGVPPANAFINFNNLSTANLSTVLNQNFSVNSISVTNPAGPVSIGGANNLTINSASGIDLSAATQDLTVTAPVVLGGNQSWNVAANRKLSVNGGVSGSAALTIAGAGQVSLSGAATHTGDTTVSSGGTLQMAAANVLPNVAGSANVNVNGALDLNANAQAVNGLNGSGVVDNTAAGPVTLTIGSNNTNSTFSGMLQNTAGALALVKTGTGTLTLSGSNSYSGGTTINAGNLVPGTTNAVGTGTVTVNSGGIFYPVASLTFTNAVTLNGGTLEIGGGNNNVLGFSGLVTVTADSAIKADGSTYGVYVNGGVNLGSGHYTLSSFNNNSGKGSQLADITGANGTIMNIAANGTLWIQGTNAFAGMFRASNGPISFLNVYSAQNATLDMNAADSGSVSFGTDVILGALTGSRDLNLGIRNISIGNNNANTTYSGAMTNSGSVTKVGTGTLTLSANSTYTGNTVISNGTLALSGGGAIASANVRVAAGARFDASAVTGGSYALNGSGSLTLNIAKSGVSLTQGQVQADGITAGGTLNVTASGDALTGGESFTLFNVTPGGTFSATNLPSLGAGLNWFTANNYRNLSVNRAPVSQPQSFSVAQGDANNLTVIGGKYSPTDVDPGDTANLVVTAVGGVSPGIAGTAGFTSSNVTFTAANNFSGTATFNYTISDGRGGSDTKPERCS